MWQYKSTEELYHYGVPGMKWGQRKAKVNSTKKPVKNKKNISEAKKKNGKKIAAATLGVIGAASVTALGVKAAKSDTAKVALATIGFLTLG